MEIFNDLSVQIDPSVTIILDLGGVSGTGPRESDTPGITAAGPIDVNDTALRERAWAQWHGQDEACPICTKEVATNVSPSCPR